MELLGLFSFPCASLNLNIWFIYTIPSLQTEALYTKIDSPKDLRRPLSLPHYVLYPSGGVQLTIT